MMVGYARSVSRRKNLATNSVNYLWTCISINLMLAICFGVNPIRPW
jgi:hypothetical protein